MINNDPCITFGIVKYLLLVYTPRLSLHSCSPPNKYPEGARNLSKFVCNSYIGLVTLPGAPNVLSSSPIYSPTYHHHSHDSRVPVSREWAHSEGLLECHSQVWFTSEFEPKGYTPPFSQTFLEASSDWNSLCWFSCCLQLDYRSYQTY
jgi:hypothetical protein